MKLKNIFFDFIFCIILICLKNSQYATSQFTRIPTQQPPATTSSQCQIPETFETENLTFKLHRSNNTVEAGSFIDNFDIIYIECHNVWALGGSVNLFCQNGEWNYNFPLCLSTPNYCARSRIEGLSTRAICNPRSDFGPCKKKIPLNTEIEIKCAPGYTNSLDGPQFIKCLPNGSFDRLREPCVQNCGILAVSEMDMIFDLGPIKASHVPWHVGIYEDYIIEYKYVCSGSIISPRIIISGAHCFWDELNGIMRNSKYQIIAGKTNRNYSITNDENAQKREVEKIHIDQRYTGRRGNYLYDFAIIILKTPLEYNENILSICIPTTVGKTGRNFVKTDLRGFITGFGGRNQLERFNMLTLSHQSCLGRSPPDAPIALDKFCIYTNDGASVCRGDSGGGYVLDTQKNNPIESYQLYNLLGIISNTPHTRNDCTRGNSNAYVAVTSIFFMPQELKDILYIAQQEDRILF